MALNNAVALTGTMADAAFFYQTRQDEYDENTTYIGFALSTAKEDEAKWLIIRTLVSGNITTKTFANSEILFNKVWSAHTSYTY